MRLLFVTLLFLAQVAFAQTDILVATANWPGGTPKRMTFVTGQWLLTRYPDWKLINHRGVFRQGTDVWIQVGTTDWGLGKLPRENPNDFVALKLAVQGDVLFARTPTEVKCIRIDSLNFSSWTTYNGELPESLVEVYNNELFQNYPNPFNPSTYIQYSLKEGGYVRMTLFNTNGQLIRMLVDEQQEFGEYTIKVDLSDVASGAYIYTLQVNEYKKSRKLLLLK